VNPRAGARYDDSVVQHENLNWEGSRWMGGHFNGGGAAVVIPAGSVRNGTRIRKAKYLSTTWCGRNRDHLPEFPHWGAVFLNEAEIRMRCG
jgi:hypothetical protein